MTNWSFSGAWWITVCKVMIGWLLCKTFDCEISFLLNVPESTVSGIIKCKWLGRTATRPQIKTIKNKIKFKKNRRGGRLPSVKSVTTNFMYLNNCAVESFTEWVCMANYLHPSLTLPKHPMQWSLHWMEASVWQSDGSLWVWQLQQEWYISDCTA